MTQQLMERPRQNGQMANAPAKSPVDKFKSLFAASTAQLKEVSARHLDPERQIRLALIAMNKMPKLLDCQPMTVLSAVITASQLGLEIGGPLAEAHLVPFGKECQLIIGYQGLTALALRSGKVLDIEAELVYSEDHFEYERGLSPKLVHRPNYEVQDRGDIKLGYAIAHLTGGAKHVEVMSRFEIDAIRNKSRQKDGVWASNFPEMARKTLIRRIAKFIPKSAELKSALEHNDATDFGRVDLIDGEVVNATEARKQGRAAALAGKLALDAPDEVVSPQKQEARDRYEAWVSDARDLAGEKGISTEEFTDLWDAAVAEAEQDEHGIPTAAAVGKISGEISKGAGIWKK